jgi:hypothetical protein
MSTHVCPTRRRVAAPIKVDLRVPRVSARTVRAWLNEPPRHAPIPIAGHMYGLLLRPADRPDIDRRN